MHCPPLPAVPWRLRAGLLGALLATLGVAACDGGVAASEPQTVVGTWRLTSVDGAPVDPIVRIEVEFKTDGTYAVEGPCTRSVGQYYLTERGATLQPTEVLEELDCGPESRRVTRTARAAVTASARVGLREGALLFFDRTGEVRVRLDRVPAPEEPDESDESAAPDAPDGE